jgi:hypothetical protein
MPPTFRHNVRAAYLKPWRKIKRGVRDLSSALQGLRRKILLLLFSRYPRVITSFMHWFGSSEYSPHQQVDCCIYCGSYDNLSDEHVLPANLGGTRILYRASCEHCRRTIHKVETHCMDSIRHYRYRKNIGTRGVKNRPTEGDVLVLTNWDGVSEINPPFNDPRHRWEKQYIPYNQHMTQLVMPIFRVAGIACGLAPAQSENGHLVGHFQHDEPFDPSATGYRPTRVQVRSSDVMWGRMLAKIAYCNAVWKHGLENVNSELPDSILGQDLTKLFYFVGGVAVQPTNGKFPLDRKTFTIVSAVATYPFGSNLLQFGFRLFGDVGSPPYFVIVGNLKN